MYAGGVCKKAQKFRSKRGTQVMEGTWLKNERRAVVSVMLWVERQVAPLSICVQMLLLQPRCHSSAKQTGRVMLGQEDRLPVTEMS